MKPLILALLLAASLPGHAAIPSWIRIVDFDGQAFDYEGYLFDRVTVCGSSDLRTDDGRGYALFEAGDSFAVRVRFWTKFYNSGAVTGNPNTTGDQVVLIEDGEAVFGGGFEACAVYVP
jgi:hypothetical protein